MKQLLIPDSSSEIPKILQTLSQYQSYTSESVYYVKMARPSKKRRACVLASIAAVTVGVDTTIALNFIKYFKQWRSVMLAITVSIVLMLYD
ncbi:hypothetical protein BDZ91DRAFT_721400 [Kalaharituber pfeilii]|nr:hypothetical protein BDZ91DRAFT_721400 [Kalaharituber pfeilii]